MDRSVRCPRLAELPPPPPGKTGWPWSDESAWLPASMPDGSAWPRITVVTPSYNHGAFIEETLRSVLLQGYPNLEYVVIDGGSRDNTLDVIRRYEPWLASWVSERDHGQTNAINKGLGRTSGEWVTWINSDDLLYPSALAAIARAARDQPAAGLIYGAGAKIDLAGRVLTKIPFRPYDGRLLRTRYFMLQQSSFMRRRALEAVGGLDESLHYVMDWDVAVRLSRSFPVHAIADDIGMFRIHADAKTQGDVWTWGREIAAVGRKYNGVTDPNFIAFRLRSLCRIGVRATGWKIFGWADRAVAGVLARIYDARTFMLN